MKNILKRVGAQILGVLLRLTWLALTCLNWVLYVIAVAIIVPLEVVFLIVIMPVIWVLVGTEQTNKVGDLVFTHHDKQVWVREYSSGEPDNFQSLLPRWGMYIQETFLEDFLWNNIERLKQLQS